MADRWNEDRERDVCNQERSYGRDRAYRPEPYDGREDRSFQPSPDDRPRVFGERETGYSYSGYTGPEYGAGGYTGYGARSVGERGYGSRNYSTGGGRGYGADVYQERGGARFGTPRPTGDEHLYDRSFRTDRDEHSRFGFGNDLQGPAYARGAPRQEYERDDGPRGGGFMERASRFFGGDRDRDEESHRGRGPTGYRRSDARISEDVHDRLTEDRHIDASSISIAVKDGEVTLSGTVTDRHAKHHAEHIVEDLSGVSHVQNNLRVADRDRNRGAMTNASAPLGENAKLSDQAAGKA
jgi:hypothetical protein